MNNAETYKKCFLTAFNLEESVDVENLKYQDIEEWDSVGHMGLVSSLEEAFNIMLDIEDVIDLSSFSKGKEILKDKYDVQF